MKFSRIYLNRLQENPGAGDTVVVIDVLRSFTTAAVVLSRHARAVYPVEGVAAARELASRLPRAITVGAVGGGDPVPDFDFGNSPSALATADVRDRNVVMTTAAGVRGLQRFRHVRTLFAGSLVCARATADAIRKVGAGEVTFVLTGEWVDRDGDEDAACADYIEALLRGERPATVTYADRVIHSDFGKRFRVGGNPNLPPADLELAAQVDRFDFAMPVVRQDDRLVIF